MKKPYQIILITALVSLIMFIGFTTIAQHPAVGAQTQASATPTPELIKGEPPLESGDTQGLILGAGAIVLIILIGVLLSRVIFPPEQKSARQ